MADITMLHDTYIVWNWAEPNCSACRHQSFVLGAFSVIKYLFFSVGVTGNARARPITLMGTAANEGYLDHAISIAASGGRRTGAQERPLCRTWLSERKHQSSAAPSERLFSRRRWSRAGRFAGRASRAVTFSALGEKKLSRGIHRSRPELYNVAAVGLTFGWPRQLARNGMKGTRSRLVTLGRSCTIAVLKWSVASCAAQAASLT